MESYRGQRVRTADEPSSIDERLKSKVWQRDDSSPGLDLAAAVSNLRPVSGILKGVKNLQYELLTSNGFLPSPEVMGMPRQGDSGYRDGEAQAVEDKVDESAGRVEGGGDAGPLRVAKLGDDLDDLRRDRNFGAEFEGNHSEHLRRFGQSQGRSDSGDGPALPSSVAAHTAVDRSYNSSLLSSSSAQGAGNISQMSEKVRQYAEKASERHAGIDEETARLVRDYQQQLLEKQSDRRNMLAQVRADIEARRRQLFTSKQSFLGHGMTGMLQGDFPARSGEEIGQKVEDADRVGDSGVFGSTGGVRPHTSTDPLEGRGGLLLSSWTSRHQERSLHPVANDAFTSNKWEPIKPFIADPGRYQNQAMSAPSLVQSEAQLMYPYPTDMTSAGYPANVASQIRMKDKQTDSAGSSTREKSITKESSVSKRDKVRKSLSFEEKETGTDAADVSHVSWKDVLNDTPSSERASRTSEEEESSSPLLARSQASLNNSGRAADKSSDISGGDKSSVLTGSSSLNGSALVARAEERRVGFERRQAELRQQLLDIQQQKDSILQRYQAGQEALHQQQAALREKLLVAAAGGSQKQEETTVAVGTKELSKFLSGSTSCGKDRGVGPVQTWAESLSQQIKQSAKVKSSAQTKYRETTTSTTNENVSPTTVDVSLSGRQSLASAGTPGNISADSFLTDISYYKLKNGDYASSGATTGQRQTWASLLQGSSSSLQSASGDQNPQKTSSSTAVSKTKLLSSDMVFPQKSATPSPSSSALESPTSPPPLVTTAVAAPPMFATTATTATIMSLADHQPHELSTIMEVDTPTSSSTVKRSQQQRQRRLQEQGATSESNSSQSLSSQSSSTAHGLAGVGTVAGGLASGTVPVIDRFPELPYTFTRPGTVFDLTPDGREPLSSEKPVDSMGSARRSINFSKESSKKSQEYRVQPLTEKTKSDDDDDNDNDEDDDLLSMPMPFLVDNTPGKPDPARGPAEISEVSSDLSSLQISGFSEYLKALGSSGAQGVEHDTMKPISEELAIAEGHRHDQEAIQTATTDAGKFGPEVLLRLRQQSRDVFGDSATTIPETAEEGGHEQSDMPGRGDKGGVGGDISLGDRSSLPSMDLAEFSIYDTSEN
ncbi:hypothetical protein ElyMa_005724500 [Elysia marginata]|uniref:Uncharacterized protein n=1 Tax=Elysia marginata TaxID=1093978 RepID=A0AAV4FLR7_9GAST|nr:hypothetical protein ElyMa_005724500 [Elysia marginata]